MVFIKQYRLQKVIKLNRLIIFNSIIENWISINFTISKYTKLFVKIVLEHYANFENLFFNEATYKIFNIRF